MKTGTIRRIERERTIARLDERLPMAWVCRNQKDETIPSLTWMNHGPTDSFRPEAHLPVLGMLASLQDPAFSHVVTLARSGARVYLLVPENWGRQQKIEPELLQSPAVLIRRISDVPASAILTAEGARVWLGGPWSLRLDEQQAESLRQAFLRLFWHEAFEESWTGDKQLLWNVARERPFDVPELPVNAAVRIGADLRLQRDMRGAHVHLASNEVPTVAPQKLWFRAGPEHHDKLAKLVRQGTEVVGQDSELPDMIVQEGSGEMIVSAAKSRMRITLNSGQAADAKKVSSRDSSWSFRVDLRLGDESLRTAKVWLRNENEPRMLQAQQGISLGDLQAASLRATFDTSPDTWPEPNALALSTKYLWTVIPPKLPGNAAEDALVKRWREIDELWSERIQRVRESSREVANHQGRLEKAFSRLKGVLFGFGRANDSLSKEIDELASQLPSATGPDGAATMFARLSDVEEEIRRLHKDVEDVERREIEENEREKQKAEWQKRVDGARKDLPERQENLVKQDKLVAKIKNEISAIEEEMERSDGKDKKDYYAQKKKLDDELTRAKKNLDRLRQEIEGLEQATKEVFEFRQSKQPLMPSAAGGPRFVPTAPKATLVLPQQALPEVGELMVHQKQRYLAIRTWEQLEAGERAALRLEAKLVAMGDV